jgi:phosphoenolpyruvate carboxykinase (ATP)
MYFCILTKDCLYMSLPTLTVDASKFLALGLTNEHGVHYQLSPETLVNQALLKGQGVLNDTGALCINTGEFTGRSPQDKFIVKDEITADTVHWNNFNIPIDEQYFHQLKKKVLDYLGQQDEVWVRDAYACADYHYRLNIRVINENPWSNLFAYNMFLRPTEAELENFTPEWHIIQAPGLKQILLLMEPDSTILQLSLYA